MVFGIGSEVKIIIRAKDAFSKVFKKVDLSLRSFQRAAAGATVAGIAIAAGFAKAVKTSIDFESAFTGVRKTVNLSEKDFARLEKRFKTISTETGTTFVELSRIGEIAGQLGIEGVENLEKFTRTIADIAVSTELTSEEAAVSFARIANVMGVPISEVDRMASAVVDLGNNFATSEQEIINMTMRIMGAGKTIGLNTQEVLGMSAAMSALGIRAEMGGSAISRAMITIAKSVSKGSISIEEFAKTTDKTGDELVAEFNRMSSTLVQYAKVAGMTTEEFSKAWKEKPVEALSKVIIGLKKMTDSGEDVFGMLEDLDLKSIRITDTMLRLAGSQDGVTGAIDRAKSAWEENIANTEEAAKRYATMEREIAKVKAKFAILGDEIGDRIVPFLRDKLIPALDKIISVWDSLSPRMKDSILIFAGVSAAVFLLAGAIALVTLVSSPWLLIIFAIAAAIALLIIFWKDIQDFISKGIIILVLAFESLRDTVVIVWAVIKNAAIIAWNFIVNLIQESINAILWAINGLIRIMNKIPGINIPIIPKLDLSGIKGELTDIGELRARLATERIATARELALRAGLIEVNIENVYGTDPEEIANALQDKLRTTTTI